MTSCRGLESKSRPMIAQYTIICSLNPNSIVLATEPTPIYSKGGRKDAWVYWYQQQEFDHIQLVPIADDGGGDFICFDYGELHQKTPPVVVYWHHERTQPGSLT